MNPDAIDRALRSDRRIEPSPAFHPDVMRAVRAQAAIGPRRRFAWRHLESAAVAASVAVPLLVAGRLLEGSGAAAEDIAEAARWLVPTLSATLAGAWWLTRTAISR
jgi:hypothetical protein